MMEMRGQLEAEAALIPWEIAPGTHSNAGRGKAVCTFFTSGIVVIEDTAIPTELLTPYKFSYGSYVRRQHNTLLIFTNVVMGCKQRNVSSGIVSCTRTNGQ
jgi:hypothetical protein